MMPHIVTILYQLTIHLINIPYRWCMINIILIKARTNSWSEWI